MGLLYRLTKWRKFIKDKFGLYGKISVKEGTRDALVD